MIIQLGFAVMLVGVYGFADLICSNYVLDRKHCLNMLFP